MKKALLLLLALLLTLTTFGCQKPSDTNTDTTDTNDSESLTDSDTSEPEDEETVLVLDDTFFNPVLEDYQERYPDIDVKTLYGDYFRGKVFLGKETVKYFASDRFEIEDGVAEIEHEGMKGFYSWDDDTTLRIVLEAGKMWVIQEEVYLGENAKDVAYTCYNDYVNRLTENGNNPDEAVIREIDGGYIVTVEPSTTLEQMDDWQKCEMVLLCDRDAGTFRPYQTILMRYDDNGNLTQKTISSYDEDMERTREVIYYDENGNEVEHRYDD